MPPVIIAAGIGVAAGIGGAVISSSATKKAVNAQTAATNANNALAREQFAVNSGNLNPAIQRGNAAGGYVNDLLGIGGDPAASKAAFDRFRDSSGYKFQLSEGLGAVNSNAYARGMGQSGATMKALQDRGNALADSSLQGYLGNLQNVSNQGTQAASSLAGVSTNMVGQISNNNQNQATTVGNAALTNASNINGTINNLLNAGGYAYGSSYGNKTPSAATSVPWPPTNGYNTPPIYGGGGIDPRFA